MATVLQLDLANFGRDAAVIVGSNGKGSTAAMTAALLQQALSPVGLFTSPHLFDLNERFRIDGVDIADDELAFYWDRVLNAVSRAGEAGAMGGFEFLFLIAADWFAAKKCAATVWEAGIGGRFDPSRLIRAQGVALTSLDFEHTAILGDSLEDIARDKLDAAPEGAVVYVSESCAAQHDAIRLHCATLNVSCEFVPAAAYATPLPGSFQQGNAALAQRLAERLARLSEQQRAQGLSATRWPGRLEVLQQAPLVVIDVGHTPAAVDAALVGFDSLRGSRPSVLVCGVSSDKDAEAIVGVLVPRFDRVICTAPRHKGLSPAAVAAYAAAMSSAELVVAESVADAYRLALHRAGPTGAVYVAGGLFLAAEFKAVHQGRDPASLVFF